MNKYLALLLASCSTQAYADRLVDFSKIVPQQPQVIYVVPVQQYAPPISIVPSTYVAPESNWNIQSPPPRPVIDFGVSK